MKITIKRLRSLISEAFKRLDEATCPCGIARQDCEYHKKDVVSSTATPASKKYKRGFPARKYGKFIDAGDWVTSKQYPGQEAVVDNISGNDVTLIFYWNGKPMVGRAPIVVPLDTVILTKGTYAGKAHNEFLKRFGFPTIDVDFGFGPADPLIFDALRSGIPPRKRKRP